MRNLKSVLLFGLVLLLIAGCSKEEIQPDPLNAMDNAALKNAIASKKEVKGDHFVPFKGNFKVWVDLGSVVILPPKYQFAYADGNASHLGKTKVKLEQWWWPKVQPPPTPPVYPWYGNGIGNITFEAANGDLLFATYSGAVATHNENPPVLVSLTGIIDGGTGRFEDAAGSFNWDVEFYPLLNEGTVILDGKIKY